MVSKEKLPYCIYILIFFSSFFTSVVSICIRTPQGASGSNSPVDDSFRVLIDGNPSTYIPGQAYNISLSCDLSFKFTSFTIVVETEPGMPYGTDMSGHFDIIDPTETRFSNLCENMVENTNNNIKHRVDVSWVAPTNPNSTCVYIKASALVHRNIWHIDDGFLTKRICPEEIDDVNIQTPEVNPCCACDEAKYELVLERRWNRNTHPKDFPPDDWRTSFSELLGASHSYSYNFWSYGTKASNGLKDLAEHGATETLENEIKNDTETGAIRTIIKAPGVPFRKKAVSSTLATVRVDPTHHMVSFVTKIVPSPDWILGVARLELCLANCTWINEKVLNLFPWDVGTDSAASYADADSAQVPPDVVRRITSTNPSDYRSPFFDDTGAPMRPMATLYMTRKKLYERECEVDDNVPFECATHPWVDWTECSTKCGAGKQYRERSYKDLGLAGRYNCEVELNEMRDCVGSQCGLQEEDDSFGQSAAECELSSWSDWGPCSKSCGQGRTSRTRGFRNPYAQANCQKGLDIELQQTKECYGNACGGTINRGYGNDRAYGNSGAYGNDGNDGNDGGYGNDNGGFEQYSREPSILPEEKLNPNNYGRNQNPRKNKPIRVNQKWNTGNDYSNRESTGDIGEDGNGINNYSNNEQQATNNGFDDNNNNRDNYANTNFGPNNNDDRYNDRLSNSERNNMNTNRNSNRNQNQNQLWIGGNNDDNSRADNRSPFEDSSNSNFRSESFRLGNNNNYGSNQNTQNPYDNSNNNNNNYNNAMTPSSVYNQQTANERVTDRYAPTNTRYPNRPRDSFDSTNSRNTFGRKTAETTGTTLDTYTEVMDYCFSKPYVVRRSCKGKKVSNYWFFDADDSQCKIFTTDSCDRNQNKFSSLEICEGTCLQPQINLEQQQQQQYQQTLPQQNSWAAPFGKPQSQIRPTKAYGSPQQNRNQANPTTWRRNRIYYFK